MVLEYRKQHSNYFAVMYSFSAFNIIDESRKHRKRNSKVKFYKMLSKSQLE